MSLKMSWRIRQCSGIHLRISSGMSAAENTSAVSLSPRPSSTNALLRGSILKMIQFTRRPNLRTLYVKPMSGYCVDALIFLAFERFFLNPLLERFFLVYCFCFFYCLGTSCILERFVVNPQHNWVPRWFFIFFDHYVQDSGHNTIQVATFPKAQSFRCVFFGTYAML